MDMREMIKKRERERGEGSSIGRNIGQGKQRRPLTQTEMTLLPHVPELGSGRQL